MYLLVCICLHITLCLCCSGVIHLSHTHTDVIVGLLTNSSMYICVSAAVDLFFPCERYEVVSRNNIYNKIYRCSYEIHTCIVIPVYKLKICTNVFDFKKYIRSSIHAHTDPKYPKKKSTYFLRTTTLSNKLLLLLTAFASYKYMFYFLSYLKIPPQNILRTVGITKLHVVLQIPQRILPKKKK